MGSMSELVKRQMGVKMPKNPIMQDRVNDQQSILAKMFPQTIKNPKNRENASRQPGDLLR